LLAAKENGGQKMAVKKNNFQTFFLHENKYFDLFLLVFTAKFLKVFYK
jgi:hypothetical protein